MISITNLIYKSLESYDRKLAKMFDEILSYINTKRYISACDPILKTLVYEILLPWLDKRISAEIRGPDKRVQAFVDPILDNNIALLAPAITGSDIQLCLCGGSTCLSWASSPCYQDDIRTIFNASFCGADMLFGGWTRMLGVSAGTPYANSPQEVISDYATAVYNQNVGAIEYYVIIFPTSGVNANSIWLGVYPNSWLSGSCCNTCPSDATAGTGQSFTIPVLYYPISYTIQPNSIYRVSIYLYLS